MCINVGPKRTSEEEKAREKAKAEGKEPETAKPKEKDQHNFTDAESHLMKGSDRFLQAYNAQAAVEEVSVTEKIQVWREVLR